MTPAARRPPHPHLAPAARAVVGGSGVPGAGDAEPFRRRDAAGTRSGIDRPIPVPGGAVVPVRSQAGMTGVRPTVGYRPDAAPAR
jgi:hypothetical protein